MPNYTKPNNKNYEDKPEDWLLCSLLFADALGFLLKPGHGIFLKLSEDERKIHPDIDIINAIIWNDGKMICMHDASDRTDLKEGDHIIMIEEKDLPNVN